MNMSFALTTPQILARTKTVTRRRGWESAIVGQVLTAVEKGQGIPKGQHVVKLCQIEITGKRREPLGKMIDDPVYGATECILEGFPLLTPVEFVVMFCKHNHCESGEIVTRIQFRYL